MVHDMMKNNPAYGEPKSVADVVKFLRENRTEIRMLPEFVKLIRIILTIPVSTCSCERSFSALRRLKTYLRSTMLAERLNHFAIMNVHRDLTLNLNNDQLMDEFIGRSQVRMNNFARCSR